MENILHILHREWVYLWYYFSLQLSQIFRYWVLGMVLGAKRFALYLAFTILFALATGWLTDVFIWRKRRFYHEAR